jgi:hypothetical protein
MNTTNSFTTKAAARRAPALIAVLATALLAAPLLALTCLVAPAQAQQVVKPKPGAAGTWRLIGQTHADHAQDHDTIVVQGPYDNFRRIKFKVTDAPLNMQRMVVTYDNGAADNIDIRQNIPQGGESRVIDLRGVGKRSLRRIDFWYDTQGFFKGKADVTVFGMK